MTDTETTVFTKILIQYRQQFEREGVWDVVSGTFRKPSQGTIFKAKLFRNCDKLREWDMKDTKARCILMGIKNSQMGKLPSTRETGTAKAMWDKYVERDYPKTFENGLQAVSNLLSIRPGDHVSSDAFLDTMLAAQTCVELQGISLDEFTVNIAINKLDHTTKHFVAFSIGKMSPKDRTVSAVADHTLAWGAVFIAYTKRGFSLDMNEPSHFIGRKSFREVASDDQLLTAFKEVLNAQRLGRILADAADNAVQRVTPLNVGPWFNEVAMD